MIERWPMRTTMALPNGVFGAKVPYPIDVAMVIMKKVAPSKVHLGCV